MVNAIRAWRLIFMLAAALIGLVGIVAASLLMVFKLASTKSFGKPYMAPLAPFNYIGQKDGVIRSARNKLTKRSKMLTNNLTRARIK